jgi:putative membrane protein
VLRLIRAAPLALLMAAAPAWAHEGPAHAAGHGAAWTFNLAVTGPLGVVLAVYLIGLLRLHARSRAGRSKLNRGAVRFLAGWALLAGSLVSPLHAAGERSFTMHMVEHELIMLPAALLLASAHAGAVLMWGLPPRLRRMLRPILRATVWRSIAGPVAATALQSAALVLWHMPALFDRAIASESWHIAQHLSFVFTALLFWWAMLAQERTPAGPLVAALCLFVTSGIGGGLGALMALDASPWYAPYAALGMTPFGLSPAEDQQLAGTIMWVPGGLFHLVVALVFLGRALRSPERRSGAAQPQKFSTIV